MWERLRVFIVIYEGINQTEKLDKLSNKVVLKGRTREYKLCVKAYALRLQKEYEMSAFTYLEVLETEKDNIEAIKGLAFCYSKMENYDEAIKYYDCLRKLTPFDKKVYYELGVCEFNRQNFCKSIKYLIKAIKLHPEYYDAIYALAQAHEELEEFEMAEMIYLKIIHERPSYIMAYNRLSELYLKIGEFEKGIKILKEILFINPDFHRAYLAIAIAYDKLEDSKHAIKYYKKYLELKPFSKERKFIQERFEFLRPKKVQNQVSYLNLVK